MWHKQGIRRRQWHPPHSSTLAWKIPWMEEPGRLRSTFSSVQSLSRVRLFAVHGVTKNRTWLNNFTFTFHFHALEKEMATHSSVLAWRILGTGEPGGLPSMGLHRVGLDWSDLVAAAAAAANVVLDFRGRQNGFWLRWSGKAFGR